MVESTLSTIENGLRGTSLANVRLLAQCLACDEGDLFGPVTPQRLAEIRAAYHQREAERARAEAAQ